MKLKLAVVLLLTALGALVRVVFGGTVSTVNVQLAGVVSVLPAASMARTSNVCSASLRFDRVMPG